MSCKPLLVAAMLAASLPSHAVDLEPARDALRRHDYDRAAELLRFAATGGDPEAAFMLGQLLRYGRGVASDLPEACRLLEQSAGAGYARAAASLAAMLDGGECTESARTAGQWRDAAEAGGQAPPPVKDSAAAAFVAPAPGLLLRAAATGDLAEVRRQLASVPVDAADDFGRTPLLLAAEAGKPDVVRELLGHHASTSQVDHNGDSALLLAARAGSLESVDLLLAAGAPVDAANKSGVTPLMVAAHVGSSDLTERLVTAGANPSLRDAAGLRAGDYASRAGQSQLGADLGVTESTAASAPAGTGTLHAGRSTLMIAAERGDLKSIDSHIAAGADLDAQDARGMTALAIAVAAGKGAAVDRLLAAGATIDARDTAGWTALGHALRTDHAAIAVALIHAGADVRSLQGNGTTPLLLAVGSRQAGLIAPLVQAGARIDAADASGATPLIAAAAAGADDCVEALLTAGARPALVDKRGRTALWHAANRGSTTSVDMLSGKSPVNAADADGTTPLAAAAARGHDAVIRALLGAGADAGITSRSGNTPLHVAAAAGHGSSIKLLAGSSGDVDTVNRHQETALILAVRARCIDCARTLLTAGASARLRNSDGLTAADVAGLSGDPALIKLFN
jgi:ankyrin repeat protein